MVAWWLTVIVIVVVITSTNVIATTNICIKQQENNNASAQWCTTVAWHDNTSRLICMLQFCFAWKLFVWFLCLFTFSICVIYSFSNIILLLFMSVFSFCVSLWISPFLLSWCDGCAVLLVPGIHSQCIAHYVWLPYLYIYMVPFHLNETLDYIHCCIHYIYNISSYCIMSTLLER